MGFKLAFQERIPLVGVCEKCGGAPEAVWVYCEGVSLGNSAFTAIDDVPLTGFYCAQCDRISAWWAKGGRPNVEYRLSAKGWELTWLIRTNIPVLASRRALSGLTVRSYQPFQGREDSWEALKEYVELEGLIPLDRRGNET